MRKFLAEDLKELWKPREDSDGEDNGQVTIIGGSKLFHGAPIFSLKAASRCVDMVFFSSPETELEKIAAKAQLSSFIWVPWEQVEAYISKSDAVLIGPGLMRYRNVQKIEFDEVGIQTRIITKYLLQKYPEKKWVIDGGSLQVMDPTWIPKGAVLTPNKKEFELLFKSQFSIINFQSMAKLHKCVIVYKSAVAYVTDGDEICEIDGGNAGLTKGGTGDTLAGLITGLLAKNPPLLAAAAGTYILKKTAERLFAKVGFGFNADDLVNKVFETKKELVGY